MLCLEGQYICERSHNPPPIKYYEPDKACYVNGVFYQQCKGHEPH